MPRPALREDEIEAFRERLCDAATRRFAERGIEGVSLRGLADDLGCSRATPYRYFKDKGEILAAVRTRAFEGLAGTCEAVVAGEPDPERRLAELGRRYLGFARDEPHAYKVAFELGQPDAMRYPALVKQQMRAWQTIRGAVQYAHERGAVEGDPATVSHLYWAALHGLAGLELLGHLRARSLAELEAPMIELLLRGARTASREGAAEAPAPAFAAGAAKAPAPPFAAGAAKAPAPFAVADPGHEHDIDSD